MKVFRVYFILLFLCGLSSKIKFKLLENQYILSVTLNHGHKMVKSMGNSGSSFYAHKMIDTSKMMVLKST